MKVNSRLGLVLLSGLATGLCFPSHRRLGPAVEAAVSCMVFEPLAFLNEAQDGPALKLSPVSQGIVASPDHIP